MCVGELAGGNEWSKIYRVEIPNEDDDEAVLDPNLACMKLLEEFHNHTNKKYEKLMTA